MPSEWIARVLVEVGAADGLRDARRLVAQGGVSLNGERITDEDATVSFDHEARLKVGRKSWLFYEPSWTRLGPTGEESDAVGQAMKWGPKELAAATVAKMLADTLTEHPATPVSWALRQAFLSGAFWRESHQTTGETTDEAPKPHVCLRCNGQGHVDPNATTCGACGGEGGLSSLDAVKQVQDYIQRLKRGERCD